MMKATILGCGGSGGVPLIGGDWGMADPAQPRNRRSRPSLLVACDGTQLLIDTSPDMRAQLLSAHITSLDAVLYTHAHADHCHGIDDLRAVNWLMRRPLDIYADPETLAILMRRFDYCFAPIREGGRETFARPVLKGRAIVGPFSVGACEIIPFTQDHGFSNSLGFRFGPLAYSTDVIRLDEAAFTILRGIDTWIVDCVRLTPPHAVHAHWEITRGWIERVKPRRAILTHMNQTMDYDSLLEWLPPGVEPGYDGLTLEWP
jgi:phosphoribosyl 1,2-cyclic phosphate phosphodiesterase